MQVASSRGQALRGSQARPAAGLPLRPRRVARLACSATAEALRSADAPATSVAPAIKLFYRTGWDKAVAHGSLAGASWKDFPLVKAAGVPNRWLVADIPLEGEGEGAAAGSNGRPLLEFVVADAAKQQWDKPQSGGNYQVDSPGVYSLRGGSLQRVAARPVMVVSDLDGTMVGDDAATGAFKSWWEDAGALAGGVLVYNTGRSLQSFLDLLKSKSGCMAVPDALILAVGTCVYLRNPSGGPADSPSGWREDRDWSGQLDQSWSLKVARDACYKALAEVGKDAMHFRPAEEQNDHKVTCGVADPQAAQVVGRVNSELAAGGVAANVITSGHGGWKYLDVVPIRAGKLEALNHVRRHFGFSVASTVACGDSGNDILMLSGENLAIVVGNAQPDLRTWAQQRQAAEAPLPSGKHRLLQATKKEALGILEGLEHFGFK
ncbi:hypothetical protein HYH02_010236 [Chlamydomonas schloesseri]|uniref:Sucrose phosphatase-like domain-containing protein n=1 Tax=Chlamydomonas schloesseri TaxID=2026947 RepID=A0A835TBK4_9CHLO|nr:hypothetical protein HYH02_010236 [Chlamydomonas schloesseri]|eukprot:KAG2440657.1 hypothetical protein HYH02_010236 [Chlamydomonas schloesseri]